MTSAEKATMSQIQERVRQKFNPRWKAYLEEHRATIAEMGVREGEGVFNAFVRWKKEGRMNR